MKLCANFERMFNQALIKLFHSRPFRHFAVLQVNVPTPEPFPNAVPLQPREAACGSATIIESCCVQEHVNVADSVQVIPAATVPKARL